jgi:hypothetical protein
VIEHLERTMHPWSSFLVIPIFALANAGVNLDLATIEHAATSEIAWGIVVGLVVGKPLGIMAATGIGLLFRLGRLPVGVSLRQVFGVACIAGIGFTVSLFVADLSFVGDRLSEAKTGILAASLLSAMFGIAWLLCIPGTQSNRRRRDEATHDRTVTQANALADRASYAGAETSPDQIYAAMVEIVDSERRWIRWERTLLWLLVATTVLEIIAAFRTGEVWWALCATPLVLASVIVTRTISGRKRMIEQLTFEAELYVGPHSPWAPHTPDTPTQ